MVSHPSTVMVYCEHIGKYSGWLAFLLTLSAGIPPRLLYFSVVVNFRRVRSPLPQWMKMKYQLFWRKIPGCFFQGWFIRALWSLIWWGRKKRTKLRKMVKNEEIHTHFSLATWYLFLWELCPISTEKSFLWMCFFGKLDFE